VLIIKTLEITFFDQSRSRNIPVCIYLPEAIADNLQVVMFNPGYCTQEDLVNSDIICHKNYAYLAEFFTARNYAFISIAHDILGDNDGLETIDPKALQHKAREHLWIRGVENISFLLVELKQKFPQLNLEKFIIAGHSNGGDIAKYFANLHPVQVSSVIVMDGRRCRIEPSMPKLLMFEASDTSTDIGVIPDEGTEQNPKRINLEYVIIKPKNAMHMSYANTNITEELRNIVYRSIDWFLWV